jgi:hypothetical protein
VLGFLGGTGPEGKGLALRFALAGEKVFIGSRDNSRGIEAANSIKKFSTGNISGGTNSDAASKSDIIIAAMPYEGQQETLEPLKTSLSGKIVITVVAPLIFDKGDISALPVKDGSAALEAQKILPESRVIGAFQNISARDLLVPGKPIEADVIVCGDDQDAKDYVITLANMIQGVRGINGGGLKNTGYVENLTALLLNINKVYKVHSSIRISGV